jgi:hypothetical protein
MSLLVSFVYLQHMSLQTIIETWKSFSLPRKVISVVVSTVVLFIGALIIVFVVSYFMRGFGSSSFSINQKGTSLSVGSMPGMAPRMLNYDGVSDSVQSSDYSYGTNNTYGNRSSVYATPAVTTRKAEDFELTSYQAQVESRDVESDCQTIQNLKSDEAIIFISANTAKDSCSFSFKTEKTKEQSAVSVIKALNPKSFTQNVATIEDRLTSYDRRKEILEHELTVLQKILDDAITSYEALSKLAITTGSVTNLRQAIYDKVDIIERLTQKKLTIEQELRQLGDSTSSSKEEIQYVQFSVSVYKNTFVDKEALASSWKYEIKQFISEMNKSLQTVTIGLVTFIFTLGTYILYLLIIVVIVKYLKRVLVYIWRKE